MSDLTHAILLLVTIFYPSDTGGWERVYDAQIFSMRNQAECEMQAKLFHLDENLRAQGAAIHAGCIAIERPGTREAGIKQGGAS
jgi:hypothetical protein